MRPKLGRPDLAFDSQAHHYGPMAKHSCLVGLCWFSPSQASQAWLLHGNPTTNWLLYGPTRPTFGLISRSKSPLLAPSRQQHEAYTSPSPGRSTCTRPSRTRVRFRPTSNPRQSFFHFRLAVSRPPLAGSDQLPDSSCHTPNPGCDRPEANIHLCLRSLDLLVTY